MIFNQLITEELKYQAKALIVATVVFGLPVLITCKHWVPCLLEPIQNDVALKQLSSSTIHCLLLFILSIRQ